MSLVHSESQSERRFEVSDYNIKKLARVKAQQNQPRWKAIETKQEEKQRNGNKNKPDSQRIKGKNKKEKTNETRNIKRRWDLSTLPFFPGFSRIIGYYSIPLKYFFP